MRLSGLQPRVMRLSCVCQASHFGVMKNSHGSLGGQCAVVLLVGLNHPLIGVDVCADQPAVVQLDDLFQERLPLGHKRGIGLAAQSFLVNQEGQVRDGRLQGVFGALDELSALAVVHAACSGPGNKLGH